MKRKYGHETERRYGGGVTRTDESQERKESNMTQYEPERERLYAPEIGWYISYGIRVCRREEKGWKTIMRVQDVSVDQNMVEKLARLCTEEELTPSQLPDVIADWI